MDRALGRVPPSQIPLATDVDLSMLAKRYELSGGEIKNAVLRAALMAGGQLAITGSMIQKAIIAEMEANGKVVRQAQ